MYDLLSNPTVIDAISPESLAHDLVQDMFRTRHRFIELIHGYEGDRTTFSMIIADALNRQGLSLTELADSCDTVPTTISRWAKGAAPSRLARRAAVERLRDTLGRRVGELAEQLPSGTDVNAPALVS